VIYKLIDISGKNIPVHIDNKFLRNNEISVLTGDPAKLTGYVGGAERRSLDDTLSWMYFNE
jgi:GDP-D-mannose dehydratase